MRKPRKKVPRIVRAPARAYRHGMAAAHVNIRAGRDDMSRIKLRDGPPLGIRLTINSLDFRRVIPRATLNISSCNKT